MIWANALVWIFLYLLPFIFWKNEYGDLVRMAWKNAIVLVNCLFVFYFNYYCLTERLLFRQKTSGFLLANFGVITLCSALMLTIKLLAQDDRIEFGGLISNFAACVVLLTLLAVVSTLSKAIIKWIDTEKQLHEEKQRRKEAELINLKQQINPHFFFNTLNNIYALIAIHPEKAQDAVLELSRLMRYVLDENSSHFVPLYREVDFVRNYVGLMRIRLTDNIDVQTRIDVPADCKKQIAPMIFISLIENAFKHGISHVHPSFVHINIRLQDDRIVCKVSNSNFPKNKVDKSGSGIGLENLRHRLEILYPNKYTLRNEVEGNSYVSELVVPLM